VNQTLGTRLTRLGDDPVLRVAAYYVLLAAATALIWQVFPGLHTVFSAERLDVLSRTAPAGAENILDHFDSSLDTLPPAAALALTTALCMAGAFLLMIPVAWVYILTRQKKGFRQSVVQTLIILPIVVAGVVLLVKNSIALAFSLGGIVAAVSFRNTLRDTKDAVYIFLATGVGLAAGVQVMSDAAMMSFLFNVVIHFWYMTSAGPRTWRAPRGPRGFPAWPTDQRVRGQPIGDPADGASSQRCSPGRRRRTAPRRLPELECAAQTPQPNAGEGWRRCWRRT
jgi:hypothetical protein